MRNIKRSLHVDKKLITQWLVILATFFIMVLIGNYFGTRLVRKNIVLYTHEFMNANATAVSLYLNDILIPSDNESSYITLTESQTADLTHFIKEIRLMDSGYSFLIDGSFNVIVHPDTPLYGIPSEFIVQTSHNLFSHPFKSQDGEAMIANIRQLPNGWYLGVMTPSRVYNRDLITIRVYISAAGFLLALVASALLTYMHMMVYRSDEANRIKSFFLANMSHEIRTPMNTIIGIAELLTHEPLNEKQSGYVRDIHGSAQSLMSIVNDIADLSKIEAGKLTLNPVDYDFNAFIDNIVSLFTFVAHRKGLLFAFESEGNLPMILFGDDIRMRQVLTNLCDNAVKFTEKGQVKLKVSATVTQLTFSVSDTGSGIPPLELSKIFDAFEQPVIKKSHYLSGTGLGLSNSKSFIEMMGGSITVESELGTGTTFTVRLPVTVGHSTNPIEKIQREQALSAPNAHVLVVDDNVFNLKVAKGLLNLFNITAETVMSGEASLALINEKSFDLVFMDHMMPDMDGVEVTLEIRRQGLNNLPIIALTANVVAGAMEMFLANGFTDFLAKPINIHELSIILRKYLPSEKITGRVEALSSMAIAESRSPFIGALDRIGAINIDIGLSHSAGMESLYRDALEVFYVRLMQECFTLSAYMAVEDISGFSISIHALKSMLSNVGAVRLSETASALEIAATHGDLPYCLENFTPFKDALVHLHEQLSVLFHSGA